MGFIISDSFTNNNFYRVIDFLDPNPKKHLTCRVIKAAFTFFATLAIGIVGGSLGFVAHGLASGVYCFKSTQKAKEHWGFAKTDGLAFLLTISLYIPLSAAYWIGIIGDKPE